MSAPTASAGDLGDETVDFSLFHSMFQKTGRDISAQTLRKGEKDFESHGTLAQAGALEHSRTVMEDVLSYTRVHRAATWVRGWYFPDQWADWVENPLAAERRRQQGRWPEDARNRVVVIERTGPALQKHGRTIKGLNKEWLLPEEALFLVERGSLDLWWPTRGLDEVFAARTEDANGDGDEEAEYHLGIPLSLQAAYALLIGEDHERGKISLQKFQVYSNLKRMGYQLCRAQPSDVLQVQTRPSRPETSPPPPLFLLQWLFSLLPFSPVAPGGRPFGPLVRPGIYRSYQSIYQQLAIVPRHTAAAQSPASRLHTESVAPSPYQLHFYVWKPSTPWSRTRPPPSDYCMAVVDAQDTGVPTLEEMTGLLNTAPWAPPQSQGKRPGGLMLRLKHGQRNVLVAVVDHGIINYMRFAEGSFEKELIYEQFDRRDHAPGPKRGGGGARGGGRGGRGHGRGRGRR